MMIYKYLDFLEESHEKTPSGKKIHKKYLKRKPKAMKKEVDEFRGKKEYKAKWDADYDKRSGERIETRKSDATKAFDKKFNK